MDSDGCLVYWRLFSSACSRRDAWQVRTGRTTPQLVEVIREAATRQQQIAGQLRTTRARWSSVSSVSGQLLERIHRSETPPAASSRRADHRAVFRLPAVSRPGRGAGQEVIYVEGRNDGKLIARRGGLQLRLRDDLGRPLGRAGDGAEPVPDHPSGHPEADRRTAHRGREELGNPAEELDVKQANGENRRPAVPDDPSPTPSAASSTVTTLRGFSSTTSSSCRSVSLRTTGPTRKAASRLLEEYTYLNLKFNVGLTDWDFDHRNEEYQFLKDFSPKWSISEMMSGFLQ